MNHKLSRRKFTLAGASGLILAGSASVLPAQEQEKAAASAPQEGKQEKKQETKERKPVEAQFERDYPAPKFKPSWKNEQVNRLLVQDFVIYAHSDLKMVKKLLEREPGLINAAMDWGKGDFETALGGASHMGRKDIVKFLLSKGARIDIFCATMLGMLEVVKAMLTLEPNLIDARGPHGFNLHFHAQVGTEEAKPVLDYLQSVKEKKLRPVPFLRNKKKSKKK